MLYPNNKISNFDFPPQQSKLKQPTFTHIFTPYQIGTLVFSEIIN